MPLDGTRYISAPDRCATLYEATQRLGLQQIPIADLLAHQAAEVKKHPGSWWYRHHHLGTSLTLLAWLGSAIGAFTSLIVLLCHLSDLYTAISALAGLSVFTSAFVAICSTGIMTGRLVVNGPAEWREDRVNSFMRHGVPDDIATMAVRLTKLVPGSYSVLGTLEQNSVILDPYLVVRYRDEQVVLGIWDDHGVIHQATME